MLCLLFGYARIFCDTIRVRCPAGIFAFLFALAAATAAGTPLFSSLLLSASETCSATIVACYQPTARKRHIPNRKPALPKQPKTPEKQRKQNTATEPATQNPTPPAGGEQKTGLLYAACAASKTTNSTADATSADSRSQKTRQSTPKSIGYHKPTERQPDGRFDTP